MNSYSITMNTDQTYYNLVESSKLLLSTNHWGLV